VTTRGGVGGAGKRLVNRPGGFWPKFVELGGGAGRVLAGGFLFGKRPAPQGAPANGEYDWNRGSGSLGCQGGEITADRDDDGHPLTDKLMCDRRQPVVAAIRPLYWKATLRPSL